MKTRNYRRFEENCCLRAQSVNSPVRLRYLHPAHGGSKLGNCLPTTRHHIIEDLSIHTRIYCSRYITGNLLVISI